MFEKYLKISIFSGVNETAVYLRRNQLIASVKVMNYLMTIHYFFCNTGSKETGIYIEWEGGRSGIIVRKEREGWERERKKDREIER